VVTHRHDGQGGDVWVTELARGTTSRLTFDESLENSSPIWSPDGSQIVFASVRAGKWGLYLKSANGAGAEERLVESDVAIASMSWSPDGRSIVYWVNDPNTQYDLWLVSLSGNRKAVPLLHTPFSESHGQVSPDGKWLAYYSNETGQNEVHVRPFPAGAGNWQVSTSGGVFPRWRRDGRELFYMERVSSGQLMAVDVSSSGSTFEAGTPKELFNSDYINLAHVANYHTYAVSADGQHFLIPRPTKVSEATDAPIAVVLNWAEALKK
jgi:Tol biopolymer transport system component